MLSEASEQQIPANLAAELALFRLRPYLKPGTNISLQDGIPAVSIPKQSAGMKANAHYFSHPEWMRGWLESCHRSPAFVERWRAATGCWNGRIVVDVGCGPGNVYASVGGSPALLIGVDIAGHSLKLAQEIGYVPLLADAHNIPLQSGFADIVTLSATLHHCDDMAAVLIEAARLVGPGGRLVSDHDPHLNAYNLKGLGLALWNARLPFYRLIQRGGHRPEDDEQAWALASEIHHRPGDGVTAALFYGTLRPLGFDVRVYRHNNRNGAAVLQGKPGRSVNRFRAAQKLSGINPDGPDGAMTLMCVAYR